MSFSFFFQAEDGIRDWSVTGVQTCALPIWLTMFTCAASMFRSGGSFQVVNFVVLRSNLRIVAWYMLPSHRFPARSARRPRRSEERRVGKEGRSRCTRYH